MFAAWDEDFAALAGVALGDRRRNRRLCAMIAGMSEKRKARITELCDSHAETKAAYRLLAHADQWQATVAAVLRRGGLQRVAREPLVLAIQDTTHLDFAASPANGEQGFWLHTLLAASPAGVPLGVLAQQFWQRDPRDHGCAQRRQQRPLAAKESRRWIDSLAAVSGADWPADCAVIVLADREGDIFELFAAPRPAHCDLLIRAAQPRRVTGPHGDLWTAVAHAPVADQRRLALARRPDRPARTATLQVRFTPVVIQPPASGTHDPQARPVPLWAVAVSEVDPPAGEAPIDWVLLSTRPVTDVATAWQAVDHYRQRWLIERFHYTLKSGCKIEESQLHEAASLGGLLTLYSWVAWRLLALTHRARVTPDAPATTVLLTREWQAAWLVLHPRAPLPSAPPTLAEAVGWIARLGGHQGRRGDGPPGVKVLWRGLTRLHDIMLGMILMNPALLDVGNA